MNSVEALEGNTEPNLDSPRTCKKCGQTKRLLDFALAGRGPNGIRCRRHECAVCHSASKAKWYEENSERILREQKESRKKSMQKMRANPTRLKAYRAYQTAFANKKRHALREEVFAAYGGYRCVGLPEYGRLCDETDPDVLSIDHINNDGCSKRKNGEHPQGSYPLYYWLKKNGFPKEFQVLCMNCQHKKSRSIKRGVTTIPKGSTLQANGNGSAPRPKIKNWTMI